MLAVGCECGRLDLGQLLAKFGQNGEPLADVFGIEGQAEIGPAQERGALQSQAQRDRLEGDGPGTGGPDRRDGLPDLARHVGRRNAGRRDGGWQLGGT